MYINKTFNKKTGRTYITYYDAKRVDGKIARSKVEGIGYLDELPHDLEWYKEEAKRLTAERRENREREAELRTNYYNYSDYDKDNEECELVENDELLNFGVAALSRVYHELDVDYFINNRRRYTKAEYNHNSIFKLLAYSRILYPGSKLANWRNKEKLIDNFDFSDDDVYRSLPFFAKHRDDMIKSINKKLEELKIRQNKALVYYDVTNYYCEIDNPDEDIFDDEGNPVSEGMRKRGCSKEHRPEPIVQMGLMMDENGIPVSYGLFPGNNNDVATFQPMMEHVKEEYRYSKLIYVGDKGMMSGMNIASLILNHHGFVISASARKAAKEIQQYMLDDSGYICTYDEEGEVSFKYKERFVPTTINVATADGKNKKEAVNVRQIVFYSKKYKDRAWIERQRAIDKAIKRAKASPKNAIINNYGANRYIEKSIFDSESNEPVASPEFSLSVNANLIGQEEALDGYYLIYSNVAHSDTAEPDKPYFNTRDNALYVSDPAATLDIIEMYRGLWRIEHCFRITKSLFKARPIFVRNRESIEAHFLSCYVSLVMVKVLEHHTEGKIEVEKIIEALRKAVLVEVKDNKHDFKYQSCYCSNVLCSIGKALNLPLNQKMFSLLDIRKMMASTKKK